MKTLTILLGDDGDSNKILIFGMQENLLKLSELDTIYVDGIPSPPVLPYFTISSQLMALLMVSSSLRYTDSSLPTVEQIPHHHEGRCRTVA